MNEQFPSAEAEVLPQRFSLAHDGCIRGGILGLIWTLPLVFCGPDAVAQNPQELAVRKQIAQAGVFDFGKVRQQDPVEHTFEFSNPGPETLELKTVQLTPPLLISKMSRRVAPGESGFVTVQLGTVRQAGDFEGIVIVQFTRPETPNVFFRVQGRVVRPIDFEPLPAFYITSFKGEAKPQSIEIVNYESEPLQSLKAEHSSTRFTTDLAVLDPGRRYRLTVTMKPDAPAGKTTESLRLLTSNQQQPLIQVPVNTQVRERVYTFPESITLGLIDTPALKAQPHQAAFLSRSVLVYRKDGTAFQISTETDLPFLRLTTRQAQLKDRFEVQVEVIPEKLKAGPVNGMLRFLTNDPEFPKLEIPVTGQVNANW